MLSNTQFIENVIVFYFINHKRVYDEDIQLLPPEEENDQPAQKEEQTREQLEVILVPKYREAMGYGLQALTSMILDDEDELDEEEGDEEKVAEKPKSLKYEFNRTSLPAIIGTREFNEDDYCGLNVEEEESDESEEENEFQEEAPELHEESGDEESDFSSSDEEEAEAESRPRSASHVSAGSGKSDGEKSGNESEDSATARRRRIQAEGVALPGLLPPKAKESQRGEETVESPKEEAKEKEESLFGDSDLFADADSFLGFAAKPRGGLDGNTLESLESALFADVEAELDPDNLFGVPKKAAPANDSLFDSVEAKEPKAKAKVEPTEPKKKSAFSLFGEEEEEESQSGSLFGEEVKSPKSPQVSKEDSQEPSTSESEAPKASTSKASAPKATSSLFDDASSLFGDLDNPPSLFGGENIFAAPSTSAKKTEKPKSSMSLWDDNPSGDLFGETKETKVEKVEKVSEAKEPEPQAKETAKEAVVDVKKEGELKKKKLVGAVAMPGMGSLFDGSSALASRVADTKKTKLSSSSSLFGDEEESDSSLFGSKPQTTPQVPKPEVKETKEEVKETKEEKKEVQPKETTTSKSFSLFGDDLEEDKFGGDLFGSTTKSSLFDDSSKAGKEAPKKPEERKVEEQKKAKTNTSASLFGDDDSSPDPLGFLNNKKPETKSPTVAAKKVDVPSTSLLDANAPSQSDSGAKSQRVKALQDKLALNPALMLGGAPRPRASSSSPASNESVPMPNETTSVGQSFNNAAESPKSVQTDSAASTGEVLTSLTRSRPMAKGRRLPSRVRGKAAAAKAPPTQSKAPSLPSTAKTSEPTDATSLFSTQKTEEKKSSLFGETSDSIFDSLPITKQPTPKVTTTAEKSPAKAPMKTTTVSSSSIFDDLDTSTTTRDSPTNPPKPSESKPPKPSVTAPANLEDIFSDPSAKKEKDDGVSSIFADQTPKKKKPKKKKKSLFD